MEHFTRQSVSALQEAARRLSEAVDRYVLGVAPLQGSATDLELVHELNDDLNAAVHALNERIISHSGTVAFALLDEFSEGDELVDDLEEIEPEGLDLADEDRMSILSRWDVVVVDAEELLDAGRAAYLRQHPQEGVEDAVLAITDVAEALWTALGDDGRLWFSLPGIEPVRGLKIGIVPDGDESWHEQEGEGESGDAHGNEAGDLVPRGGVVFRTERW